MTHIYPFVEDLHYLMQVISLMCLWVISEEELLLIECGWWRKHRSFFESEESQYYGFFLFFTDHKIQSHITGITNDIWISHSLVQGSIKLRLTGFLELKLRHFCVLLENFIMKLSLSSDLSHHINSFRLPIRLRLVSAYLYIWCSAELLVIF